jgi:hypothetical protein
MDNILYLETIIDEIGYKPRGFCITELEMFIQLQLQENIMKI